MLAAFPLHIVGETEEEKELILRSLRHGSALKEICAVSALPSRLHRAKLGLGDETRVFAKFNASH